jgi:hypothetical protein
LVVHLATAGVIATPIGWLPTLISAPGLFVATSIGVTVPLCSAATYAVLPLGVIAIPVGWLPPLIAISAPALLLATSIGVTVPGPPLVT